MAFDPHKEDFQRLGLRFARSLPSDAPLASIRQLASFGRRFAQERDSLPQTDADRAFRLVAEATRLIDYQLPFATDEEAETIIAHGHRLIDEALALDPACHDARRMKMGAECPSFESYYDFLRDEAPKVREDCVRARQEAELDESPERAAMGAALALRPYLRWLATLAAKAVICGRNRAALAVTADIFELDPFDEADARFTAALALAKLEDESGLEQLAAHGARWARRPADDAWMQLARASLAYRRRDHRAAREHVSRIVATYPHAVPALALQRELPDGVFSRLAVAPYSEDELILAVSEGTVLLQEGRDAFGKGSFGAWIMLESLGLATKEQLAELSDLVEHVAAFLSGPGRGPEPHGVGGGRPDAGPGNPAGAGGAS